MKKAFSSLFLILLLLLIFWVVAAWFYGTKIEEDTHAFIDNINIDPESTLNYELVSYERSPFKSKANLKITINNQGLISELIDNILPDSDDHLLNIDIFHGPIFLDKKALKFGSSLWKVNLQNNNLKEDLTENLTQLYTLNKYDKSLFHIDFNDVINYLIPVKSKLNNGRITGIYDKANKKHEGKIISSLLIRSDSNNKIDSKWMEVNYQHIINNNFHNADKSEIRFTANIPSLEIKHQALSEALNLNVSYKGNVSVENSLLNSVNNFSVNFIKPNESSAYPIEQGDLSFNFTNLNLDDFLKLNDVFEDIKNVEQQSQWILEEQGAFPEGQDQIWQRHDAASLLSSKISVLLNKVITAEQTSTSPIKFSFNSNNGNKQSRLNGAVYTRNFDESDFESNDSLFSLLQAQSQVTLDDDWFQFLSTRLPITKPKFKLTYKDNKLLMQ